MNILTRENARDKFKAAFGAGYQGISSEDIALLVQELENELKDFELSEKEFLKINEFRKKDTHFSVVGHIKMCQIRCSSFCFKDREAITFNNDGFIGFAGWADKKNIQPFLRAFINWVEKL